MDINPENQFDFWLGEWEAAWREAGKGTNHVERILDGKVVQENFVGPDLHGISFSFMTRNGSCGVRPGWITTVPILISLARSKMGR
jgi:hypothetical protein